MAGYFVLTSFAASASRLGYLPQSGTLREPLAALRIRKRLALSESLMSPGPNIAARMVEGTRDWPESA